MNYRLPTTHYLLFTTLTLLMLSSCSGVKNVTYFQKMGTTHSDSIKRSQPDIVHTATIKPMDLLSITVVTTVPETSRIFNLVVPQITESTASSISAVPNVQTFLVDENGNIDFPVFGKLAVKGLTRTELVTLLQGNMETSFKQEHPIITVRITNFSVNFVGEVERPGKFGTSNERLTIFEGLALAGDLTIYGKRDKVKVLREDANGAKRFLTVDLNDENIIYSPAYFLEQNDVVYVEPNGPKSRTAKIGPVETLAISAFSIVISIAGIVINILK